MRFEALEPRLLLAGDLATLAANGTLTLNLTGGNDQVVLEQVSGDGGGVIVNVSVGGLTQQYGTADQSVKLILADGLGGDDRFTLSTLFAVEVDITGGTGNDTLVGPAIQGQWEIDGANSGSFQPGGDAPNTKFTEVELLRGGAGADRFILRSGGSISGGIDGGGGVNTLIGPDASNEWRVTGADSGSLFGVQGFTAIANLYGGNAADLFSIYTGGSISGVLNGGLDNAAAPADDSLSFSSLTTAVTVDLALASATGVHGFTSIEQIIGSASTADVLRGPGQSGDAVSWSINALNAGVVEGTGFSGFENLRGAGLTSDSFSFDSGGSLTGSVDGGVGVGAVDSFKVGSLAFQPLVADQSGTITLAGTTVRYAGMDSLTPVEGDAANRSVHGTAFADTITLEAAGANQSKVSFGGLSLTSDGISFNNSFTFDNPTESLTITGGTGSDTLIVKSLSPGFAANLLIYGREPGAPALEPDIGHDLVRFDGNTLTHGGYLEVFADSIAVSSGVTLSTLADASNPASGNDIVFRARRIGTPEIENLLPAGYLSKSVGIDLGVGAKLQAASIYLVAQAEDRALATSLGLTTLQSQFFLDKPLEFLNDLVSLPIKVLIKASDAHVNIGQNAQVLANDVIGIYATAASDASGQAKSSLFSVGYSQADATATIDVAAGASIQANGAINITSGGEAVAKMTTETSDAEKFAASVAVSNARLTSTVNVAATAMIHGGRTVNVRALGSIESEAESESGVAKIENGKLRDFGQKMANDLAWCREVLF